MLVASCVSIARLEPAWISEVANSLFSSNVVPLKLRARS